jgi:hypothetical protein
MRTSYSPISSVPSIFHWSVSRYSLLAMASTIWFASFASRAQAHARPAQEPFSRILHEVRAIAPRLRRELPVQRPGQRRIGKVSITRERIMVMTAGAIPDRRGVFILDFFFCNSLNCLFFNLHVSLLPNTGQEVRHMDHSFLRVRRLRYPLILRRQPRFAHVTHRRRC